MTAEALTQAEIDALLRGASPPQAETGGKRASTSGSTLPPEEEEAVRKYAEFIASSGGATLSGSTYLGENVTVTVEEVTETDSSQISQQIPGEVVACALTYKGILHGQTLFVLGQGEAMQLAGQITGGGEVSTIGDLEESAIGEAIHQIINQANTQLSTQLGGDLGVEAPELTTAPKNLGELLPPSDEPEILIKYIIQSGSLTGPLYQVLPRNLLQGLMEAEGEEVSAAEERRHPSGVRSPDVLEQPATFQPSLRERPKTEVPNLELILDIPLEIRVELGRTTRKIREVLELGTGSVVELDKLAGEPVDILVNNKLFARGEVVVIDENFGVRITDILTIEERIEALK